MAELSNETLLDSLRKNRLFILGAGFSAAAGIPLTAELLFRAMNLFAKECPGIFSRVCNYAKQATQSNNETIDFSKVSFSDLCTYLEFVELREYAGGERWSDAGSREKLALRFYLAKALAMATPGLNELPDLYLQFANQLHDGDCVLTFNWDCLLEAALTKLGKLWTYNYSGKGIKLVKLHGSINWRLGEPTDLGRPSNTLDWQSLNFARGMARTEIFWTQELFDRLVWNRHSPLGEVQPFLVLPGYGKAFDVRDNASLWYKLDFVFGTTHDVYIIGLSLAPDDFFIRSFFLSSLPEIDAYTGILARSIFVINPDPNLRHNYEFILNSTNCLLLQEKFSTKHVDLIRNRQLQ